MGEPAWDEEAERRRARLVAEEMLDMLVGALAVRPRRAGDDPCQLDVARSVLRVPTNTEASSDSSSSGQTAVDNLVRSFRQRQRRGR